jgi:hypothetical protein
LAGAAGTKGRYLLSSRQLSPAFLHRPEIFPNHYTTILNSTMKNQAERPAISHLFIYAAENGKLSFQ